MYWQAKKNGATAVEFDLEYTEDGVAILFHDDTVDRMTNGTGEIRKLAFEHVRSLNAAAGLDKWFVFPIGISILIVNHFIWCCSWGLFSIEIWNISPHCFVWFSVDIHKSISSILTLRKENENIPTVEEGIQACLELGLVMYFDIKSPEYKVCYIY